MNLLLHVTPSSLNQIYAITLIVFTPKSKLIGLIAKDTSQSLPIKIEESFYKDYSPLRSQESIVEFLLENIQQAHSMYTVDKIYIVNSQQGKILAKLLKKRFNIPVFVSSKDLEIIDPISDLIELKTSF